MIIRIGRVELSAIAVPHSVLAVLSARYNHIVGWVPITGKNYSIMCLPLNLLLTWLDWKDGDSLVIGVEDLVIFRRPGQGVNGLLALNQLLSQHPSAGPYLDAAIFTSCGHSSSFIAPSPLLAVEGEG